MQTTNNFAVQAPRNRRHSNQSSCLHAQHGPWSAIVGYITAHPTPL